MLDKSIRAAFIQNTELVIDCLGVPITWTQTKKPNTTKTVRAGFKTAGLKDTEVVNAYGLGAKIIVFKASDFGAVIPEKFDTVQVHDQRYTLDTVDPKHDLDGNVAFYYTYVKGK